MKRGRTDKQDMPLIPVTLSGRAVVWRLLADPIWASGHAAAPTGRTHERIRPAAQSLAEPLNPRGRSLIAPPMSTVFVAVALPGSRFSPRSTYAAATSGPKHRHCNVHSGLTRNTCGPTASLAVCLHPRPDGQLAPALLSRAAGSHQGWLRRPRPALTSGMARLTAKRCAGSQTACGQAPHGLCPCRSASQWPPPSPSSATRA